MKPKTAILVGYNGPKAAGPPDKQLVAAETDPHLIKCALETLDYWIPNYAVRTGLNATFQGIAEAAYHISQHDPVGLIFFFSGHGILENFEINRVQLANGLYSVDEIRDVICRQLPDLCRLILMVDACRNIGERSIRSGNGNSISRSSSPSFTPPAGQRTSDARSGGMRPETATSFVFSCSPRQRSAEWRIEKTGVFTGGLVRTLLNAPPNDPLRVRDLANLELEDQTLSVLDIHDLALRTLGDVPPRPLWEQADSAVSSLACSGNRTLCLHLDGTLKTFTIGERRWKPKPGRFVAAVLSDQRKPLVENDLTKKIRYFIGPSAVSFVITSAQGRESKSSLYLTEDPTQELLNFQVLGIQHLAFLEEGERLKFLIADHTGSIATYEPLNHRLMPVRSASAGYPPSCLSASPSGTWAAWSDWNGSLSIWNHFTWEVAIAEMKSPVTGLALTSDGLIAVGLANGSVMLGDAAQPNKAFTHSGILTGRGIVTALAFLQEKYLVVGYSSGLVDFSSIEALGRSMNTGAGT